mgnify:CR=1 FL=1|tara:strand:+ start:623 stop:1006 length:384 start_codon:yes stop_codon:yes gene_type:complete
MTTQKKTNILTVAASFLGSVITIITIVWSIGQPHLEKEIKRVFINELNGAEVELFFQAKADVKEREYKKEIKENQGKGFRMLCGDKLGVPFDEAHIEIGHLKTRIEKLELDLQNCCNSRSRNQMLRI